LIDVGGGKECPFLPYFDAPYGHLIIAVDISEQNCAATRGSVTRSLPMRPRMAFRFAMAQPILSYPYFIKLSIFSFIHPLFILMLGTI